MKKINSIDLNAAQNKINGAIESLLPLDDFPSRAKAIEWRAEPHLLDEICGLFERTIREEGRRTTYGLKQSAMIHLMFGPRLKRWLQSTENNPLNSLQRQLPLCMTKPEFVFTTIPLSREFELL